MKKLILLIGIVFLSIGVYAQQDLLFRTTNMGSRVLLTPKTDQNPFIGMKRSGYTPKSEWLTVGINTILKSSFNEKQQKSIFDAKIFVNVYGDWSGEIKYVDFLISKSEINKVSFKDLNTLQQKIKQIKVPQSENLSVHKTAADYFKLTYLLRCQSE
ncbi:MAG: hypothetical protein LRY59_03425 [Bacteroides graminisolvens]|jgi:hypothetical protein|nr:hypothetical protein [Bacteroides graminisolvens]